MSSYVELDVDIDVDALIDAALDRLAVKFPGIQFNEAHLEVAVIEEMARLASESADIAAQVSRAVFREFGRTTVGVLPIDGAPAGMLVTVTFADDAGYTLPGGYKFGFRTSTGDMWMFETTAEAIAENPATQAFNVPAIALDVGTDRNDINAATDFEPFDAVEFVSAIASSTITSGGVDAETDDEYLNRLSDEFELFSISPVRIGDFAKLARRTPGVHRALAVDGYNPDLNTHDNERFTALAPVDEAGNPVSAGVKAQLDADMEARREINFDIRVFDPTYTDIAVVVTVQAEPGYDQATLDADVTAAIAAYLDPATWGDSSGDNEPPTWDAGRTTVFYLELAEAINAVPGVDRITTTAANFDLTVNAGRVDVALAGEAPLPSRVEAAGSTVDVMVVEA